MRRLSIIFVTMLVLLATLTPSVLADNGTLVAHDGKDVADWELELLIRIFIDSNYESMVLAFTECYGGDKFDDFAGYANTALLSGSNPGNTTIYGGYHRALAGALRPGRTTDAAHADGVAGAAAGDTPMKGGANVVVGGTLSTHVLVWAGVPNDQDWDDINDIRNNFNGPTETVTVLAGNGVGADGAATFGNLAAALANIGAMMNPLEQFVLFVTDHGGLAKGKRNVGFGAGAATETLDAPAWAGMLATPSNQPYLTVFTEEPLASDFIASVDINGYPVGSQPPAISVDYDDDLVPDMYQYIWDVDEGSLAEFDNEIDFALATSDTGTFWSLSLESGDIPRLEGGSPTEGHSWGTIKSLFR